MISLNQVTKKFTDIFALNNVSFDMSPGEIIGLVGANGAGKSTLVKILQGEHSDYTGTIKFNNRTIQFNNPSASISSGVAVVSQDPALSLNLTVLENLFLGRELKSKVLGWLNKAKMKKQATEVLQKFNADFLLEDKIRDLTRQQTQIVEIAKHFLKKSTLLILDEPTTSLASSQIEILYNSVRIIAANGTTVVLVTHNLEQVLKYSTQIAILRDGKLVSFENNQNITTHTLHRAMFGDLNNERSVSKTSKIKPEIIFEAQKVSTSQFTDLNFQVYFGDITGLIAPYTESPSEILKVIFGISPLKSGAIFINGKLLLARFPRTAIKAGIGYLPDNRRKDGLFWERRIFDNIIATFQDRISKFGWVRWNDAFHLVDEYSRRLAIKMISLDQPVKYLSGGNQQKVLLARWLLAGSNLLLLDEPFSGIDIKSRGDILEIFKDLQDNGKSALLVSTAPDDLMQSCNKFIFLRNGKIERVALAEELTVGEITDYMEGRKHYRTNN